jgi:hypothetical protein
MDMKGSELRGFFTTDLCLGLASLSMEAHSGQKGFVVMV